MLNSTVTIKIKERINKLDSQDYDNILCWQIVEAFNKAQVEWCRRQLHGINTLREGDEQSTRRKDDLQAILVKDDILLQQEDIYYRASIPTDYLQWKRIDVNACKGCCDNRRMTVYLAEEENLNQLLRDKSKQPNFSWAETFATLTADGINIYTNGDFEISESKLTYYRQPILIQIAGCINPYTEVESTTEVI